MRMYFLHPMLKLLILVNRFLTLEHFGKSRDYILWSIYFIACCFCFVSSYGQGWEKKYQVGTLKDGYSFIQTSDNGYLIVGTLNNWDPSDTTFTTFFDNGYALKLNNTGDVEWIKYYDSLSIGVTDAVVETNDGGYMIVGQDQSLPVCAPCCNPQMMMMKITSNGDEVWRQTHGCGINCTSSQEGGSDS